MDIFVQCCGNPGQVKSNSPCRAVSRPLHKAYVVADSQKNKPPEYKHSVGSKIMQALSVYSHKKEKKKKELEEREETAKAPPLRARREDRRTEGPHQRQNTNI